MLNVSKTDVWSAPVEDKPGGLVARIEDLVLKGNLDLEFLSAQRFTEQTGTGGVFLMPIRGERQEAMASHAGFVKNDRLFCLRVTGSDEPGIVYRILKALAGKGLNLRAASASAVRGEFVMYLALSTPDDADKATRLLMSQV